MQFIHNAGTQCTESHEKYRVCVQAAPSHSWVNSQFVFSFCQYHLQAQYGEFNTLASLSRIENFITEPPSLYMEAEINRQYLTIFLLSKNEDVVLQFLIQPDVSCKSCTVYLYLNRKQPSCTHDIKDSDKTVHNLQLAIA